MSTLDEFIGEDPMTDEEKTAAELAAMKEKLEAAEAEIAKRDQATVDNDETKRQSILTSLSKKEQEKYKDSSLELLEGLADYIKSNPKKGGTPRYPRTEDKKPKGPLPFNGEFKLNEKNEFRLQNRLHT
ncbi:hypothetical protein KAR91_49155 [Candidatus Pacearchaeota archaeon]|nr:hypothetical protein [Candidatus Pacearchaeota archaeon]